MKLLPSLPRLTKLEGIILATPVVMAIGFYWLRSGHRLDYYAFVKEDGIAEYIQALCFLMAAVAAVGVSHHFFRMRQRFLGVMFALFALGTFGIFGEEISWGQRIFGWETPEAFATNMQQETTLHNDVRLKYVVHPSGIAVGLYAVLSPLLARRFLQRGWRTGTFFTTELPVIGFFAAFAGVYVVYEYLNPLIRPWYGFDLILWQDLEMAESFFAAGVLAWTVLKHRAAHRLFPAPAAEAATTSEVALATARLP